MDNKTIEQGLTVIKDKIVIKYVMNEFSTLADTKEIDKEVIRFSIGN